MLDLSRFRRTLIALLLAVAVPGCSPAQEVPSHQTGVIAAGIGPDWRLPPTPTRIAPADSGMVATTDSVATAVGLDILRRGGNAVDAAVATHFALAVVNPEAGNIGGGGFLVARLQDGEPVALDFREAAPLAATRDMYLDDDGEPTEASVVGHLAAGVPGSVAGMWEAHQRFGTLPWAELVEPAISLADGLVVHERLGRSLADYARTLRGDAT